MHAVDAATSYIGWDNIKAEEIMFLFLIKVWTGFLYYEITHGTQ